MARSFTRRDFLSGSLGVGAAGALHTTLGPVGSLGRSGHGAKAPTTGGAVATSKPPRERQGGTERWFSAPCTGATTVSTRSSRTRAPHTGRCAAQIAIAHDQALPLGKAGDVALGLHPAMVGLKSPVGCRARSP